MILKKIISGGQTGADQAALDAAIKMGLPHAGWIPRGRLTEDGPLPLTYALQEMPTNSYPKRTEQNVLDSDGTVIFSHGPLTGGSKLIQKLARQHKKPCLHINLDKVPIYLSSSEILKWVREHEVEILNVAGPRASKDPSIHDEVIYIVQGVILLDLVKGNYLSDVDIKKHLDNLPLPPKTVDDAVTRFINDLDLKDRVLIAKMSLDDLVNLHRVLESYFNIEFGLGQGNPDLLESCRALSRMPVESEADASVMIIGMLHKRLRETHLPKVVE
ncbi:MAG: putative molybdenum carrier protein [Desulfobacterales bacterium]|nr:putative molybdenum carrier protein [Desulfobacterales bacterium]